MTDPKQLTEEIPENPQELRNRGLILSSGQLESGKILTEDLPQEEDLQEDEEEEEEDGPRLLTED